MAATATRPHTSASRLTFAAGAAALLIAGGAGLLAPPATTDAAGSPPTTATEGTGGTETVIELGERISVIPSPPRAPVPPVTISIAAIDLGPTAVRPVGLDGDGQLEVPGETEVGWYRHSSWPGRTGATVLAAHVSWNDARGPFFFLVDLQQGATIKLELADGSRRDYTVTERIQYLKTELPAERVWTTDGPETLVLITCGGDFNPEIRRYRHNVVVYARPGS
jgi:hypothetical protein